MHRVPTILIFFTLTLLSVVAADDPKGSVRISATFVAFPEMLIHELQAKDITAPVEVDHLAQLLAEGKGTILAAPTMTVADGVEGVVHDEKTRRYAQDIDVELGFYSPGDTNIGYAAVVKPQDWEDIGVGVSLKAVTVIYPDNQTIGIDVDVRLTEAPQIIKSEISCITSAGKDRSLFFEQAEIKEYAAMLTTELQHGETILLAGGMATPNEELVYICLTCEILSEAPAAPEKQ